MQDCFILALCVAPPAAFSPHGRFVMLPALPPPGARDKWWPCWCGREEGEGGGETLEEPLESTQTRERNQHCWVKTLKTWMALYHGLWRPSATGEAATTGSSETAIFYVVDTIVVRERRRTMMQSQQPACQLPAGQASSVHACNPSLNLSSGQTLDTPCAATCARLS